MSTEGSVCVLQVVATAAGRDGGLSSMTTVSTTSSSPRLVAVITFYTPE